MFGMKRKISLLLAASLLLSLLTACQPPAAESDPPAAESGPPVSVPAVELSCLDLVTGVWGGLRIEISADGSAVYYGFPIIAGDDTSKSPEEMAAYIQGAYGLDEGEWEEACIVREGGMSAVELAALRFADENAAQHGYDCLKDYLHAREGDFTGYAPAQARLAADGALVMNGLYVGLFIVEGSDYARQIFTTMVETGGKPEPEPIDDVNELLDRLLDFCERKGDDVSNLERVDGSDPEKLKSIATEEYMLADNLWEEAAVARGTGGSVFEIAVLRAAEGQDAWELCHVLVQDYLDVKENSTHFPAQAELLSKATAANPSDTDFVILAVCGKPDGVAVEAMQLLGARGYVSSQRHFNDSNASKPVADPDPNYPNRIKFVDPGKEDMSIYDTSAIRAAWEQGDPAGLSGKDRAVYDAAETVLGEIIQDGMTDLEKETAIYYWVVHNVNYGWQHMDVMAELSRAAYEPYGGLVDREAVCLGYAATFQMLCDLAGVECITIAGACFSSEEHHAWNMVRLNGEWYCVDVTWDSNFREQSESEWPAEYWNYFNVTSDEMAKSHQWDYANTPEATAEDRGQP